MDGFPETVTQARLVFGDAPLEIPETMEEAAAGGAFASNSNLSVLRTHEVNAAPPSKEPCEEARLPSFVFILDAAENYLLDRLKALSEKLNEPPGNEEKRLARFEDAITVYRKQFLDTDYSLSNFFECARTVAKTLTPGGRGVTVSFLKVDAEPLLSPPPPESQYSVAPPSEVARVICERVGKPRNFGPTPQQQYQEKVREIKLLEEERT
ncbi:protein dpy-30, partial [Trypanosoma cruzi]